jgi:hypothetical protein
LASAPAPQLIQAALVLTGAGHLHPAQEPSRQARTRCAELNRHLCERARSSVDFMYLASPIAGAGISVSRPQQLFLLAAHKGRRTPSEQGKFAWEAFAAQGQRMIKDGKVLESAEENVSELSQQATEFSEKRAPILKALRITL